jgi:hypothetical protein
MSNLLSQTMRCIGSSLHRLRHFYNFSSINFPSHLLPLAMLCTNLFSSQILFKLQSNGDCESIVLADVFRYCCVLYSCSVAHYSCSVLLFCISLHCTLLCCIILHHYLLQSAALYCSVLCFIVLHFAFTAVHCSVPFCTAPPPRFALYVNTSQKC